MARSDLTEASSANLVGIWHRLGALRKYVSSISTLGVAFLCHSLGFIILARNLPTDDIGELAMLTAISSFGASWCELGICEMARRRVGRDESTYAAVLGHSLILIFGLGGAISVPLILGSAYFLDVGPTFAAAAYVAALIIPANVCLFIFINFAEQLVTAKGRLAHANYIVAGTGLARAVMSAVACYGFGVATLAEWAPFHLLFYLLSSVGAAMALWPYGRPKAVLLNRELLRGVTIAAWSSIFTLRQNIDLLVLNAIATPHVVGNYSVARRVLSAAGIVSTGFDRIAYSHLVIAGREGVDEAAKLARKYFGYIIGPLLVATVCTFYAAVFIDDVFGSKFDGAIFMTQALSGIVVAQGLQNLAFDALNAAEQHSARLAVSVGISVLGCVVMGVLAWVWRVDGLLIGIVIAEFLTAAALWGALLWLGSAGNRRSLPGAARRD